MSQLAQPTSLSEPSRKRFRVDDDPEEDQEMADMIVPRKKFDRAEKFLNKAEEELAKLEEEHIALKEEHTALQTKSEKDIKALEEENENLKKIIHQMEENAAKAKREKNAAFEEAINILKGKRDAELPRVLSPPKELSISCSRPSTAGLGVSPSESPQITPRSRGNGPSPAPSLASLFESSTLPMQQEDLDLGFLGEDQVPSTSRSRRGLSTITEETGECSSPVPARVQKKTPSGSTPRAPRHSSGNFDDGEMMNARQQPVPSSPSHAGTSSAASMVVEDVQLDPEDRLQSEEPVFQAPVTPKRSPPVFDFIKPQSEIRFDADGYVGDEQVSAIYLVLGENLCLYDPYDMADVPQPVSDPPRVKTIEEEAGLSKADAIIVRGIIVTEQNRQKMANLIVKKGKKHLNRIRGRDFQKENDIEKARRQSTAGNNVPSTSSY